MDFTELEQKWYPIKGLRPLFIYDYRGTRIAIAETDLEYDIKKPDFPFGFYQTSYAVAGSASRGQVDVVNWLEFEPSHDIDKGWTQEQRRRARVESAKTAAQDFVDACYETDRYAK